MRQGRVHCIFDVIQMSSALGAMNDGTVTVLDGRDIVVSRGTWENERSVWKSSLDASDGREMECKTILRGDDVSIGSRQRPTDDDCTDH